MLTLPFLGRRPLIMGIVNVTPDSFSGDGLALRGFDAVLAQATRFWDEGADILDIGGESSRPGATPVSAENEIKRVVPVIRALHKQRPDRPLSVDTTKPAVAAAALEAGAVVVNDTSGGRDSALALLAVRAGAYLVVMHTRARRNSVTTHATLGGAYEASPDPDITRTVCTWFEEAKTQARAAGLAVGSSPEDPAGRLILDPGLGFGKTTEDNLCLLRDTPKLRAAGCPLMVGPSRKHFIGQILGTPANDRLEGSAAAVAAAALGGADIVRVHDVRFMARLVRMTTAIRG